MNSGQELWNTMKWQVTKKLGKSSFIFLSFVYSLILLIRPTILFLKSFLKKGPTLIGPSPILLEHWACNFNPLLVQLLGIWLLHLGSHIA
jgi:hypothetical protein